MIQSLLIANRGEIACRIIRTAREMGIRTVAVYSDADAKALHVRQADEAVHIGPSPANESYLVGEKIIAAAKQTGAEAIHPGYGFLSENADFAQAVQDAGLIWVGPNPDSIRAMGLKDAAKKLMQDAGVPVTPGYMGDDQSPERLAKEADAIGYPVLIKAVAGGGGKGMRKVDAAADFGEMLQSCRREAKASFGNDEVLLEKWITSPRHIEVQVFGDSHGNVVHLFERDCSLQRRHQKVIEEAPAPGMDAATREELCCAAIRAAKAVDYVGAGTIEFIADASEGLKADRIWFMEMNTRLQVEHPVTEEITGVDLVEWQLRVAGGEELPLKQDEIEIDGWAIEARLYAEDPATGFLPSVGRLERFHIPVEYRIDTGVEEGATVSPFYDPMIAKVITWAPTRDESIDDLKRALDGTAIWPVKSNAGFLYRLLEDDEFLDGEMTTGLIASQGDALLPEKEPSREMLQTAALHLQREYFGLKAEALTGFRMNAPSRLSVLVATEAGPVDVPIPDDWIDDIWSSSATPTSALVSAKGMAFAIGQHSPRGSGTASAAGGAILSPMPGKVIAVDVAEGDAVTAGQRLLVLEAMKMEHALTAPFDGTVAELNASEGGQVQVEAVLAVIEKAAE
ncbi:acetyl/propionyl/methylcrotonyl-CoA carboxylase subunit alpha [Altererythrobacter sp. ZODW24]|uniref:acetyl-CoA carboxylase biotin carboxylase subunit n=1 Tax=Altererythrobacter sp. ZODW24 TaxID=2185142 RepID=UPI000DF7A3C9|nr:acetyl/propionyl/methylcrotonyl-CoA carboxylase subunit alpha [Altererythrobacter sp. ZODW24]